MQALTKHWFGRDLLMTYSRCGLFRKPILSTSRTLSTQPLSLHTKCHQNILFSLSLKFVKDHDSFKVKYLMFKHIHKPTETFQYTHFSSCHPPSVKKGFVKGEALCLLRTRPFICICRADPLAAISIREFTCTMSEALGFIF